MNRLALMAAALGFAIPSAAVAAAEDIPATSGQEAGKATPFQARHASKDATERRETTALNQLEVAGYHDHSNITADGTKYRATVTKNGQQSTVLIDPDHDVIKPAR